MISNASLFLFFFEDLRMEDWEKKLATFRAAYPIWKSGVYTKKVFKKLKVSDELLKNMLVAIQAQKDQRALMVTLDFDFIPPWKYPSTWLNQGCWEDDVTMDEETLREQYGCYSTKSPTQRVSKTIRDAPVRAGKTEFNPFS